MSTLDDWTDALCAELGLDPQDLNQKTVLNLARVALAETAAKLQRLARAWPADD
jgi:hypothetical protein